MGDPPSWPSWDGGDTAREDRYLDVHGLGAGVKLRGGANLEVKYRVELKRRGAEKWKKLEGAELAWHFLEVRFHP